MAKASPYAMTNYERRLVAFHETGHAALIYWRRESLHQRRIALHRDRFGGSTLCPVFDLSESDLMVLIGGPMAEFVSYGVIPKVALRFSNEYSDPRSDSSRMRALVRKLRAGRDDKRYQMEVQERVRQIVQQPDMWNGITAVAEHLVGHGEIAGEMIETIFEQIGVNDQFGDRPNWSARLSDKKVSI